MAINVNRSAPPPPPPLPPPDGTPNSTDPSLNGQPTTNEQPTTSVTQPPDVFTGPPVSAGGGDPQSVNSNPLGVGEPEPTPQDNAEKMFVQLNQDLADPTKTATDIQADVKNLNDYIDKVQNSEHKVPDADFKTWLDNARTYETKDLKSNPQDELAYVTDASTMIARL